MAPPSRRMGEDKPEEIIHPSLRKAKHKPNKRDVDGAEYDR